MSNMHRYPERYFSLIGDFFSVNKIKSLSLKLISYYTFKKDLSSLYLMSISFKTIYLKVGSMTILTTETNW